MQPLRAMGRLYKYSNVGAFGVARSDNLGNARSLYIVERAAGLTPRFSCIYSTSTLIDACRESKATQDKNHMEKRIVKFLTIIVAMAFSLMAHAQDVIVKTSGSTIAAKVIEVGQSEIKYKKFNNQGGPTYTILKTDVNYIAYENGEKESFAVNSEREILRGTITTPTQSLMVSQEPQNATDAELMRALTLDSYNEKAKRLKRTAFIGGGVAVVGAAVMLLLYEGSEDEYYDGSGYDSPEYLYASIGCLAAGAAWTTGFLLAAKRQRNKDMYANTAVPILQMKLASSKNSMLSANVNMMSDNISHHQTLGFGLNFHF